MPSIDRTTSPLSGLPRKIVILCATGAGAGYVPICPGTVATLLAIPLSIGLNRLAEASFITASLILAATILCAISLAGKAAEILQQKDPGMIVIDEIGGYLLANFAAPTSLFTLLLSFCLFRFFDIAKVFPASRLERLPGGAGIVADDVMAGVYTFAAMRLLHLWGMV